MIFIDTNVISETLRPQPEPRVLEWLIRHDSELAIPSIVIAELAFGIYKLQPDRRTKRPMSAQDGMIAAIARAHGGKLATRNIRDFEHAGVDIVNPWSLG